MYTHSVLFTYIHTYILSTPNFFEQSIHYVQFARHPLSICKMKHYYSLCGKFSYNHSCFANSFFYFSPKHLHIIFDV